MKARPIIMNTAMVQTILAGRKTQTRRILKGFDGAQEIEWRNDRWVAIGDSPTCYGGEIQMNDWIEYVKCPFGSVGDVLYVRETWATRGDASDGACHANPSKGIFYPATDNYQYKRKRPSIHMPRWASRITLVITDIRLEQLWDISEQDAFAEGVNTVLPMFNSEEYNRLGMNGNVYREEYKKLWESIYGAGSWNDNQWVWVISFEPHMMNVDKYMKGKANE
jgi:hypothetical protein